MRRLRWRRRRRLLLLVVAAISVGLGLLVHAAGTFHKTELQTIDARFQVRGAQPGLVKDFVIVGIDTPTLSYFADTGRWQTSWPFPRRYHARVINNLVRAGAKEIAVDIQFTSAQWQRR